MKQINKKKPLFLYTTQNSPCPYLDNKIERKLIAHLKGPDSDILHEKLAQNGFRRSHSIAYAPICNKCNECIPVRVVVKEFELNKSFKRNWKLNSKIETQVLPPQATIEQYKIFKDYQLSRHDGSDMSNMGLYEYTAMIEDTPIDTYIIEYRLNSGELVAVCLTDRTSDGLSAVYSFFSTKYSKLGLGTYTILWLIEKAKRLKLPYLYLGYLIKGSAKMDYKNKFKPLEKLSANGWTRLI